MWNTAFPGILLIAIAGVAFAIHRVRVSAERVRQQQKVLESAQNQFYRAGQELQRVRELIERESVQEAIPIFISSLKVLAGFSQETFPTLEWKHYFNEVEDERKRLESYLVKNYSNLVREYVDQDNERIALENQKQKKRNFYINTLPILILGGVTLLMGIYFLSTLVN